MHSVVVMVATKAGGQVMSCQGKVSGCVEGRTMRREGRSTEYMHIVFSQGRHESNMKRVCQTR